jgi:hypothetical protein
MKVFYVAICDLIKFDLTDCSIVANSYEDAEQILKEEYDKKYERYEYQLSELNQEEIDNYLEDYPDNTKPGIYTQTPLEYVYEICF